MASTESEEGAFLHEAWRACARWVPFRKAKETKQKTRFSGSKRKVLGQWPRYGPALRIIDGILKSKLRDETVDRLFSYRCEA